MTMRTLVAALALLAPVSCAGLGHGGGGPLPFKVAMIPFDVAVTTESVATDDDATTFEPHFEAADFVRAIRDALGTRFADAVVLPWPPGMTVEEFRRLPQAQQDDHWMKLCAEVDADLVLECDVKVPRTARYSRNEKFWLNLPVFLIGGPLCYFVKDTTFTPEGDARLGAVLHQVRPIRSGRATLANGYAEVARCDVKFDGVSFDFIDRAQVGSYFASLVVPPGLLARDNSRVCTRFAAEVSHGLAAGLAREVEASSPAILKTDNLADFFLKQDVEAVASGDELLVHGEVAIRSASAADMREYAIIYGDRRVTGVLADPEPDTLLSTGREQFLRIRFSKTLARQARVDRVRIELIQGGRDQIARTFTVAVSEVASGANGRAAGAASAAR
jgi:hypothetical protein